MPKLPTIRWTTPRVAALTGVSLLAGTALVGVAAAQTPTPTTTPQQRAEEHLNRFAQNLGVDATRVREAMKQTALQTVDQALADGRITAEQAQQARDRINSGDLGALLRGGFGGHRGPGGHGGLKAFAAAMAHGKAELATFLGVSEEQLRTELDGQSLAAVAAAHGKSADQLKAFLTSSAEQRLNEAVTAGRIDQARATQMLEAFNARLDEMINRVHQHPQGVPGMRGMPGMHGMQGMPDTQPSGGGTSGGGVRNGFGI